MLEEYFGVCLEVFFDLLDMPQDLIRTRSDEKYRAYLEEERRFTGKDAGIYVELTEESRILTLSTCVANKGSRRYLVQAVLSAVHTYEE